jgi:hypothetical protein
MEMSLRVGMLLSNSLVIAKNFYEHHIAGGLIHIVLAASLNKC